MGQSVTDNVDAVDYAAFKVKQSENSFTRDFGNITVINLLSHIISKYF